jgi:hypothetical protein
MKATEHREEGRQLREEGCVQKVSAEQRGYAQASDCERIAEKDDTIRTSGTDNLLERIVQRDNLNRAYKRVKSNKGAGGVDKMSVDELLPYLRERGDELVGQIRNGKYKPRPVRRVEIRGRLHDILQKQKECAKDAFKHRAVHRREAISQGESGEDGDSTREPREISWLRILPIQGRMPLSGTPQIREENAKQNQATDEAEQRMGKRSSQGEVKTIHHRMGQLF